MEGGGVSLPKSAISENRSVVHCTVFAAASTEQEESADHAPPSYR